jgi:pimeloyl-ACP methyl ester carboxylesterase
MEFSVTQPQTARHRPDPAVVARAFITPGRGRAKPATESPPGAIIGRLAVAGGQIATWRWGTGPAVLLVHGWEANHGDMLGFVAPLLAAGLSPVALDLPAHGASTGETATIPQLAAAIVAVGVAHGPVQGVIAHSIGAASSSVALARGLAAGRVVLLAAPARYRAQARQVARMVGLDDADWPAMEAELLALGTELSAIDLPAMAPNLAAAALFVHSADDRVIPLSDARENAARWPGARLVTVDGLGHARLLRDPAIVAKTVAFIADRD